MKSQKMFISEKGIFLMNILFGRPGRDVLFEYYQVVPFLLSSLTSKKSVYLLVDF